MLPTWMTSKNKQERGRGDRELQGNCRMMMVVPGLEDLQLLSVGSAKDLGTGHINVPLTIFSVDVVVDNEDGRKVTKTVMR